MTSHRTTLLKHTTSGECVNKSDRMTANNHWLSHIEIMYSYVCVCAHAHNIVFGVIAHCARCIY